MMIRQHSSSRSSQGASILIMTMILMIMLTVMALATISLNTTQTRIATNSADAQEAYQTAEGALNQAVNNLQLGNYSLANFVANTNGLYIFDPANPPVWTTASWSNASGAIQCPTGCGAGKQAAYIIEYLPAVTVPGSGPKHPYRITARAVGISGKSPVMLQAIVLTP